MFGKPFFALSHSLQEAGSFGDVADLLSNLVPPLIGADDVSILSVHQAYQRVEAVYGHGPVSVKLREKLDLMNELGPAHPLMKHISFREPTDLAKAASDFMAPEAFRQCDLNQQLKGELTGDDALFGRLFTTCRHQTIVAGCRRDGVYKSGQRQVFDVLLYTARATLQRLAAKAFDQRVTQFLLTTRADAPNVLFMMRNSEITPLNHVGVQMSESWWGEDEPFRVLAEHQRAALDEVLDRSWLDPVTASFSEVQLDLGGGQMEWSVIPKVDGDVLFFRPMTKGESGGSDDGSRAAAVLTRRQREIMEWIAEGKTSAEVAIILNISPRTVEKHLEAVFQRLGVENRIAAVRRYLELKGGQFA